MFDCFVHSLAHIYVENTGMGRAKIDEVIQDSPEADFLRLATVFARTGASSRIYDWRTEILMRIQEPIKRNGVFILDRLCSTNDFLEMVLLPVFPVVTSALSCGCPESQENYGKLRVNCDQLKENGIKQLEDAVLVTKEKDLSDVVENCGACGRKKLTRSYHINDIAFIMIDLREIIDHRKFPREITLKGQRYTFMSSIDIVPKIPHVVSYCQQNNGKWCLYDNSKREIFESPANTVPMLLFYERI